MQPAEVVELLYKLPEGRLTAFLPPIVDDPHGNDECFFCGDNRHQPQHQASGHFEIGLMLEVQITL